jgi:hypothetical protein
MSINTIEKEEEAILYDTRPQSTNQLVPQHLGKKPLLLQNYK